jgi:uncharacterized protein (DUF885 family)
MLQDSLSRMEDDFRRELLSPASQVSWDLWKMRVQVAAQNRPYQRYDFVFGRYGPQGSLPNNLINYHTVDDLIDLQAYISRLNQSGRYLRQYLKRAQLAAADGIRAPYFDYDQTLSEIQRVTSGAPFEQFDDAPASALWADITAKIEKLRNSVLIDEAQALDLTEQARAALLNELKPAYDEIAAWVEADRDNVSADAQGAWSLPDGKRYYAQRLATMTTVDLSAEQIHALGLAEVDRIHTEMRNIRKAVGFEGALQDFFTLMREDDQFYLPDTAEGRAEYLELAEGYLQDMYERLPEFFGILPRTGLQVRRVEAFREQAGGAAHYRRGTHDGSRPGTFYVHLSDMRAVAVNRLETLAYHEGVPGHHMQSAIQQELTNIPRFRNVRGYTAFSEGWALYAEYLAKEMGAFTDPYSDFGRLAGENWRAVRLVVDTGIHEYGWSQQRAVEYAMDNSSRPVSSIKSEIRRYFNMPGQATAYKIGMLKILEVREQAKQALGDDFSLRAFHDVVLGSGPLPLPVLEQQVAAWVARVKADRTL